MAACDYIALAQQGVQRLTPYEPGKSMETLERELGITNTLKLASNENPLGPSLKALAALKAGLSGIALYPDGTGFALKAALTEKLGGGRWAAANITLGNGSNEVLELVARAYLGPDLEAVYSAHAFAVYALATQAVGANAHVAPANSADHAQPYGHDLEAMAERVRPKTRVVFIANPNNPTGTWLKRAALESFIAALPASVLVVVDEAYCEYVDEPDYADASGWLDRFPNLIVTRTFSKIYGLAGLRIGYALSSPQVADILNRVRQPFNINSLAQMAAVAALRDSDHIENSRKANALGLTQWRSALAQRGLGFIPSVGNFVSVNLNRVAMPVYQHMLRQGVIVRPIVNYGLPDFLRITVGRETDNARALAALDRAMDA
jgi:histidinol-phosphate aminotransferase